MIYKTWFSVYSAALMYEKRKDYTKAMEGYVTCMNSCFSNLPARNSSSISTSRSDARTEEIESSSGGDAAFTAGGTEQTQSQESNNGHASSLSIGFLKELKSEIMLRIAVLKKEMGAIEQSMQMCNQITNDSSVGDPLRANALCLKGLLHEMRAEFPASEVVYRSVLQISSGHSSALERLGRVYLRFVSAALFALPTHFCVGILILYICRLFN